jgi:protein XagA
MRLYPRLSVTFSFAAAMSGLALPARAGAWAEPEGETLVIATTTFADSTRAFDANGKLQPVSDWRKFELGFNIEYGLSDRVTLLARPAVADISSAGPPTGAYRGLSSIDLGARIELARVGDAVFAAQGRVRLPGASDAANTALSGMTAAEAEGRLLAGYSLTLAGRPAFAEAQLGWAARNGGNPGEARFDLTLGFRPMDHLLALLQSFSVATTGAGTAAYPNQRWSKLQPSLVYEFAQGWSAQAGAFATVAAINARREVGAILAVWRRF